MEANNVITKPVDLIVANTMHDIVGLLPMLKTLDDVLKQCGAKTGTPVDIIHTAAARRLLTEIAKQADISKVYAALKAVGAPDTAEMIGEGIKAVQDRQRR